MKRIARMLAALFIASVCVLSLVALTGCQAGRDMLPETKKALDYLQTQDVGAGPGYEWSAFSLARMGYDPAASPLSDFVQNEKAYIASVDGVLDERYSVEYSRAIIVMTALGVDARDANGRNLFDGLSDMDFIEFQGTTGPIWALIALDSHPSYELVKDKSAKEQATRGKLIAAILAAQNKNGGWSLYEDDEPSVDITSMALTSLAPYTSSDAKVKKAVENGFASIADRQEKDGGFKYGKDESSESAAQVVVAMCANGVDPSKDACLVEGKASVLENMLSFQTDNGGFSHARGEADDPLATGQATYALVAYERFLSGQTALFDMSDIEIG